MKAKLVRVLLDHDVTFRKTEQDNPNFEGYSLQGFSVMSQHVLGNSKEEILEKMWEKEKKLKKLCLEHNKLPERQEFLEAIRKGKKISQFKDYTVRLGGMTNTWPLSTHKASGEEWLKEAFLNEYFDRQWLPLETHGLSYNLVRNKKEIDWNIWEPHRKLVKLWQSEIKNDAE